MKTTIQLQGPKGENLNVLVTREYLQILGTNYRLANKTDAMRLLMHCEEVVKRPDFCEGCGKPVARNNLSAFTDMKEYSRTLTIMGFRCVKCDLSGIAEEG